MVHCSKLIELENISFSHAGAPPVLDRLCLGVDQGELLCLAGINGSGKSTLLTLMAGIFSPGQGAIRIGPHSAPGGERLFRDLAGLVLQEPELQILGATVEEDLLLGFSLADPEGLEAARSMAERFGLDKLWKVPVQNLSHGQKKKLCLAGTLAAGKRILLLDEPFSGLDYPGIKEMRSILRANKEQGLTQIAATHDLEPLADLADRLAVLHQGRIVLHDKPCLIMDRITDYGVRPPCSFLVEKGSPAWE